MTNQQRLNANRRNAKKSTGPRTAGGRMRSRMNALKHGMAAEEVVIPGEDPAKLRASYQSFVDAWKPVGTIEAKLVWEITIADWRLQRARRVEAKLIEAESGKAETNSWTLDTIGAAVSASSESNGGDDDAASEPDNGEPEPDQGPDLAAALFSDKQFGGLDAVRHLLRYEAAVERSYYRAIHTLERFQARRMGKDVAPPQVVHVHANE